MRIVERIVHVGPSLYARTPVIKILLDLGALTGWRGGKLDPVYLDALLKALPALQERMHYQAVDEEGILFGQVFAQVAIVLQNIGGVDVTFCKAFSSISPGFCTVVYQYAERGTGIRAGDLTLQLLRSLLPDEMRSANSLPVGWDWPERRDEYIRYVQRRSCGFSTTALLRAAELRDIPWLQQRKSKIIQLGYGKYQQRILSTITARTSYIALEIAKDKVVTNSILGSCGLPVPRQEVVRGVEQAVSAAEKLKFPVVTKPNYGNHGRGISIGLMTPQEVRAGFSAAAKYSGYVIVESFVPGADYRLLVVNGELIAASRRTPAQVVGDGAHTIRELVSIANQDPRRGIGQEKPLTRLELDPQTEDTLARQGLTLDSKPLAGQMVPLRSTANLSTGGTATDVTDIIHPDNRDLAICAVTAIGLDVGGVDFICPDITASHKKIGGSICEVNAAPGLRMHMAPSAGAPRDAAGAVIDMLFPPGVRSCVPIVCITGIQGNTAISRVFARIAKSAGFSPGLATADGIYIDGSRTAEGDATDSVAAHMVLADARIDIAVLEISRDGLQRAGLGVRFADVGAVVHVGAEHLGPQEIENLDQFAEFERIVVAVTRDCVVLNADDERTARLSMHARAKHLCYVTANPQHSVVYEHIKNGGRACTLEANAHGKMITLHDNGSNTSLLSAHLVPPKLEGRTMCSIQDVMFAVALAFSINIKLDAIRHGLHSLGIPLSLP